MTGTCRTLAAVVLLTVASEGSAVWRERTASAASAPASLPIEIYRGACDASAAVALDAEHFAIGDDEDAKTPIRIYRFGQSDPIAAIALPDAEEADIEDAAAIGDEIYWIGSHSRSTKGKRKAGRDRVFWTRLSHSHGEPVLTPDPTPYTGLLADIANARNLAGLHLDVAATRAAESPDGLNIEGLARSGSGLLIGFRSPQSQGRAIMLPFKNPADVFVRHARARFGDAALLSLGGRGVRGMAALPGSSEILVIAGPYNDRPDFALYRWAGPGHDAVAIPNIAFGTLHPEAVLVRGRGAIYAVSDDGEEMVDGKRCSEWPFTSANARRKRFRLAKLPL